MPGFRKLARSLVIGLVVVVGLVSYNLAIPAGRSSASNWGFAVSHPTILLHIFAATVVLALAGFMLLRAILARSARWTVLSAAGLALLALAYLAGAQYVAALHKGALSLMGNAWLAAIVTYGIGWWLGRREERAITRAAGPDTRPAAATQTGVRK